MIWHSVDQGLYVLGFFAVITLRPGVSLPLVVVVMLFALFTLARTRSSPVWVALILAEAGVAVAAILFSIESPLNDSSCLLGYSGFPLAGMLFVLDLAWTAGRAIWLRTRPARSAFPRIALHAVVFLVLLRSAGICTV